MNLLNRIILSVYMLIMVLISICIIILPFKLIPLDTVNLIINEIYYGWYYSLIGLLIFIVSIRLLFSGITSDNRKKRGIIKPTEFGEIKISVETFESLAMRTVKQVSGIKDVKVRVDLGNGDITIYTRLLVLPDVNIPKVISEVQCRIKDYIESTTEINVKEVNVIIDDVALVATARVE